MGRSQKNTDKWIKIYSDMHILQLKPKITINDY